MLTFHIPTWHTLVRKQAKISPLQVEEKSFLVILLISHGSFSANKPKTTITQLPQTRRKLCSVCRKTWHSLRLIRGSQLVKSCVLCRFCSFKNTVTSSTLYSSQDSKREEKYYPPLYGENLFKSGYPVPSHCTACQYTEQSLSLKKQNTVSPPCPTGALK